MWMLRVGFAAEPDAARALVIGVLVWSVVWAAWPRARRAGLSLYALGASLVAIGAVTLTPGMDEFAHRQPCALGRWRPVWLTPQLMAMNDRTLNLVLFVPLGFFAALFAARSGRRSAVVAAALAVSPVVELLQHLLPSLGRNCSSLDVADNVSGCVLGLAAGLVVAAVARRRDGDGTNATVIAPGPPRPSVRH